MYGCQKCNLTKERESWREVEVSRRKVKSTVAHNVTSKGPIGRGCKEAQWTPRCSGLQSWLTKINTMEESAADNHTSWDPIRQIGWLMRMLQRVMLLSLLAMLLKKLMMCLPIWLLQPLVNFLSQLTWMQTRPLKMLHDSAFSAKHFLNNF